MTAFFGMLRKDNVTVQKRNAFNPSVNLCRGDFQWEARTGTAGGHPDVGSTMWINVRHSKTNQTFERSHRFPLLPTGSLVCPVRAVAEHFASVDGRTRRSPTTPRGGGGRLCRSPTGCSCAT